MCTPNCARPDLRTGYRATITSARPDASLRLVHSEQLLDWQAMHGPGVYAWTSWVRAWSRPSR